MNKKTIKKNISILIIIVLIIYFIQMSNDSTLAYPVMPVAACGGIDEIFFIGNRYDDKSGILLFSEIYTLDKNRHKISLYNDMTLTDSMMNN